MAVDAEKTYVALWRCTLFEMTHNDTVSIIVPVWNTEKLLPRCLDSLLGQTYQHIEVVVVDDGSPDNAGAVADGYAARYGNVKVVHKANGGLAEARHSGVNAATGGWIMFVDSDDELCDALAVEFLMQKALGLDLDIAYGSNIRMIEGKGEAEFESRYDCEREFTPDEFRRYLLSPSSICSLCGCVSRREIWHDEVFPPVDVRLPSEDVYTNLLLTNYLSRKVGLYNRAVFNYYLVAGSLSQAGSFQTVQLWRCFYEELEKGLKDAHSADTERALTERKIHNLCFHMREVDSHDPWVRSLIDLDTKGYPLKTRVCQQLLRSNAARRFFIAANRVVKQVLNIRRSTI